MSSALRCSLVVLSFIAFQYVSLRCLGQEPTAPAPASSTAGGQPAAPTKEEMPSDPAELLALAAKKNGLHNAVSNPWHLKATYEVLDDNGKVKLAGIFEEFWISERQYRISYSSPDFNQVLISNDKGLYRQGQEGTPKEAASMIRSVLTYGSVFSRDFSKDKLTLENKKVGAVDLKCITIEIKVQAGVPPFGVECLSFDHPILRLSLSASGFLQTFYNKIGVFQGSYIGREIELRSATAPILRVHVDTLEALSGKTEELLSPNADATFSPRSITVPGSVIAGSIVKKVPPVYPETAKQRGIQGIVILHAVINREGKIRDLEPIIGPRELIYPSMDAVKRWEYHPYLRDGEPVEVETSINVIFSLGKR